MWFAWRLQTPAAMEQWLREGWYSSIVRRLDQLYGLLVRLYPHREASAYHVCGVERGLARDPQTRCPLHPSSAHQATDGPTLVVGLLFSVSSSFVAQATGFETPW